jgi:hypothetical protein
MSDELTELKAAQAQMAARMAQLEAELEARAKPSPPFDPGPVQRFDPTERMSMPASTLRDMARAVPDRMMREIALRDGRAPTGPSSQGIIPSSQSVSGVRVGGGNTVPLRPPPGVAQADRLMDAADAADRVELAQRLAKRGG